jgi:hypothetical protein
VIASIFPSLDHSNNLIECIDFKDISKYMILILIIKEYYKLNEENPINSK